MLLLYIEMVVGNQMTVKEVLKQAFYFLEDMSEKQMSQFLESFQNIENTLIERNISYFIELIEIIRAKLEKMSASHVEDF